MNTRFSEANILRTAKRILGLAGLASVALVCAGTAWAQSNQARTETTSPGSVAATASTSVDSGGQPQAISHPAKRASAPQASTAERALVAESPVRSREAAADASTRARLKSNYEGLPIAFEPNVGQTDAPVKFLSHGAGFTLFLTPEEAVLSLAPPTNAIRVSAGTSPVQSSVLRIRLAGANANPQVLGLDELPGKSNYLLGSDPKKWRTNVQNFARVEYRNVYPGVNLVYYGHQGRLEDDFEIEPGASPDAIRMEITGATKIELDRAGNAVLSVQGGQLVLETPEIYQQAGGARRAVTGRYVIEGRNQLTFAVGAYDRSQPVVIDPTLAYSTYLGGNSLDDARAVAVDANGGAYLTGETGSSNFPVSISPSPTAYQSTCPSSCDINAVAFVTKIDTTQSGNNSLVYSTYLGPVGDPTFTFTIGNAIAVDASGEAVVAGNTDSAKFPIVGTVVDGTYKSVASGSTLAGSAFVFKLSADGSSAIFSTYLGGTGTDQAYGVALDSNSDVYVVGDTSTPNLATSGVFTQGRSLNSGSFAAFVTKLDSTASNFLFYAYLNGGAAYAVALDSSADAYVVGNASSATFPTTSNAFQDSFVVPSEGTFNAFFSDVSSDGTSLQYSTFLAGSAAGTTASGVAVDGSGNAYLTGSSGGAGFPTTSNAIGAAAQACGTPISGFTPCPSMFVASINPSLSGSASLLYSTFVGGIYPNVGPFGDSANAIAVDSAGDAFITGNASSTDFPLPNVPLGPNPIQSQPPCPTAGLSSCFATVAFLVELAPNASSITYSTYLGNPSTFNGSGQATFSPFVNGYGIAVDGSGNAYIAGGANPASLLTTANAFQTSPPSKGATSDSGFLIEIATPSADMGVFGSASPSPVQTNSTLTYTLTVANSGPSGATGVTLTDTLPSGISLDNATASQGTCADAGGIVTCSIGSLDNGAAASVTLTVTTPATAGILTNTATVTANESDPNPSNNTSTITVDVLAPSSVPPQIVKAFGAASIPLNGVTSLTFSITNPNSGSSLSGISFTDNFPVGLAIAALANLTNTGCGGTVAGAPGASLVSLAGGTLAAGASCTISLNVTGTSAGTIMNSVSVTSTQTGAGNTSSASLVVQAGLFSPTSGTQGQTLNVSFTGSGFVAGVTTVQFGSSTSGITVNSVMVTDSGDLVANISIASTAKVGGVNVTVTTGTTRSSYGRFGIVPPTLTVSPNTGTQGETLDVTLTGLNFVNGMTVQFGSSTSGITVNSPLTIVNAGEAIANISIALNAPERYQNVIVTNGQSSFTELHAFKVGPASLTLTPNTGTQGETLDVTLTGLTFVPGMTVQFGSSTSRITVNSPLTIVNAGEAIANITIALDASTNGAYSVTVTNGQSSFKEDKAFKVGPASLTLSPDTGTQGETLDVTLTGFTFVPGMTVKFGSSTSRITVNNVMVPNSSEAIVNITIALNASTNGAYSVTVANGQSSFKEDNAFKVGPASLTLSPNTGTQGETLDVTLTGFTFVPGMTVQFGSNTSGITVNSPLTIVNAGEAIANISIAWNAPVKYQNVTVMNGQSSFREANAFKIGPASLTLSPNTGELGQTLNVVMSGLPFESGPAGLSFTPLFSTRTFKLNSLTPIDANDAIANITIEPNASPATYNVTVVFAGPPRLEFKNVASFTVLAP